jgi:hypothetical protein
MSVKKWRQQTKEKAELEELEDQIRQKFKMQNQQRVFPAFGRRAFQADHKAAG